MAYGVCEDWTLEGGSKSTTEKNSLCGKGKVVPVL
jgi:hypothetical protein